MEQKVKWGVLGTAGIARDCTIPGMQLAENCELTAIAGRKAEKVRAYQEQFGFRKAYLSYEELLADPEIQAVYIPLPNSLHCQWVKKALDAGKHVLCEKPIAASEEQAAEMFRYARERGLYLMEAFAYLHTPWIRAVKEAVDSGCIGKITYMESQFVTPAREKTDIRMRKETLGGALYDLGCYNTSMILWMMGQEPVQVQAVAQYTPEQIDILTTGILTFAQGQQAVFNCGMLLNGSLPERIDRFHIHGTAGAIRAEYRFNQAGELTYTIATAEGETRHTVSVPHNYSLEAAQLGRCILNGERPHVTEEFSLMNARTMDRILAAIGY